MSKVVRRGYEKVMERRDVARQELVTLIKVIGHLDSGGKKQSFLLRVKSDNGVEEIEKTTLSRGRARIELINQTKML